MGYFDKVLQRLFGHVSDIREDWKLRTIQCELFSANEALKVPIPNAEAMKVFGDKVQITVYAKGDDRYRDQGSVGVVLSIHLSEVKFPEAPQ